MLCSGVFTFHPSTARKEHTIMQTQIISATEYRNVTLALLSESKTNPRRTFEATALKDWRRVSRPRAFSRLCLFGL
jgi:hypothetical protein